MRKLKLARKEGLRLAGVGASGQGQVRGWGPCSERTGHNSCDAEGPAENSSICLYRLRASLSAAWEGCPGVEVRAGAWGTCSQQWGLQKNVI